MPARMYIWPQRRLSAAADMQERMDAFLGLDAEKENVVYAAAIGRTDLRS